MKSKQTFILRRDRGWPSKAAAFTPPTAASIATANKSVPITHPPMSIVNGAIAAAHRAIIFSIGQLCLGRNEWVLISPTSANERRWKKKNRPRRPQQMLLRHLRQRMLLRQNRELLLRHRRQRNPQPRIRRHRRHLPHQQIQTESRRFILPRGITSIFIRRAA